MISVEPGPARTGDCSVTGPPGEGGRGGGQRNEICWTAGNRVCVCARAEVQKIEEEEKIHRHHSNPYEKFRMAKQKSALVIVGR